MGPQPLGDSGPRFLICQQLHLPLWMMIQHPHHVRLTTLENTPPKPTRVAWYGRLEDGASQAEGALAISGMRKQLSLH